MTGAGRMARFLALYETVPAEALDPEADRALWSGAGAIVLVHSAKAAQALAGLADGRPLDTSLVVAISEAASAPLAPFSPRAIHVAAKPNEDALMDALSLACKGL